MNKEEFITDGDYAINLNNVISAFCTLENVTYFKKPTQDDYATGRHNIISNIRTFYVGNYFLVTAKPEGWNATEHDITKYLSRAGAFRKGSGNFKVLYRIKNDYVALQKFERGAYPKDLFYPIKKFINEAIFKDAYKIKDFYIKTNIDIRTK
ncbi:MAG: hypothetical protein QM541_04310 [Flavobacterium sp.]|nr:hypothetical protein [Flavobacterium sp.]